MRTSLLAVTLFFVEGASPPSTCPSLTVNVTTAPTYNELTQYSIDSDLSPSLLSNGKDADSTQLTTLGFGVIYALDGSGVGGDTQVQIKSLAKCHHLSHLLRPHPLNSQPQPQPQPQHQSQQMKTTHCMLPRSSRLIK